MKLLCAERNTHHGPPRPRHQAMHVMAARVLTKTTFLYRPTCPRTYCASRSADVTRQERDMSRLTSVCIDGILLQEGVRALAPMTTKNKNKTSNNTTFENISGRIRSQ